MGKSKLQHLENLKRSKTILEEAQVDVQRRWLNTCNEIALIEQQIAKERIEESRPAPGAKILLMLNYLSGYSFPTNEALHELTYLLGCVAAADRTQEELKNSSGEIAKAFKTFRCVICLEDCNTCSHTKYQDANAKEALLNALKKLKEVIRNYDTARCKL